MAEAIFKFLHGTRVYVDSVGVRTRSIDGYAVTVMDEIGIDMSRHKPKTFDDFEDETESYDLVITLSPEAQHRAIELTRYAALEVEYWMTFDPTSIEGSRETILDAYRQVREHIRQRIGDRFPAATLSAI